MLAKILTQSLPGGIPIWQAIGIGLNAGLDPAMQSSHVVELEADQKFDPSSPPGMGGNNPFTKGGALNPKVQITERTASSLAWSQQDTRAGLERARMIPHIAGSALSSAPQLSYQLYKPISDLGRAVVDPFRRAGVPRVTGLEGLPTLKELIADAMAGAKIAAEVIPPPMKPEATALGLAVGATAKLLLEKLGQFWGQMNGPPRGIELPTVPNNFPAVGTFTQAGVTTDGRPYATASRVGPQDKNGGIHYGPVVSKLIPSTARWINVYPGFDGIHANKWGYSYQDDNGNIVEKEVNASPRGFWRVLSNDGSRSEFVIKVACVENCGVLLPVTAGVETAIVPWTNPYEWPPTGDPVPQPLTLPPLPLPTPPYIAPNLPTPEGLPITVVPFGTTTVRLPNGQTVQTTRLPGYWPQLLNPGGTRAPQPNKIPSLTPVTPFGPVPLRNFPGADPARPTQQVDTAAQVVPLPPTRPATTAVGEVTPWPGAAPIPAIGPAPRPTMEGIAQELGKIERKLEIMMNPAAPGNLLDKFDDFKDLINPLIEAFFSAQAGTIYKMDSKCEVDANGDKLPPVEVVAEGALTQHGVLLNRLDALAKLLQVHKNLKQPNCKTPTPTGEFVTVNFEQI